MGYFANGTEGDMYEEQYCDRCVHQNAEVGCPTAPKRRGCMKALFGGYTSSRDAHTGQGQSRIMGVGDKGDNCMIHVILPYLPPGVNKQYGLTKRGYMYLTAEATDVRYDIGRTMLANGWKADPTKRYSIKVRFMFPTDMHDLDGPLKGLLDSLFAVAGRKKMRWGALDYTVMRLEVEKCVEKGRSKTELWIEEILNVQK